MTTRMPPENSDNFTQAPEPRERRRAGLWLLAAILTLAVGVGFSVWGGDRAVAVAESARSQAAVATTTVLDYAWRLVTGPSSLDGGRIASSYALPTEGRAVVANLSEMKLYLFEGGAAVASFDIQSRGRPGTAWETPPGSYKVKTKETRHFSSIGNVWMPYSMQFQGNFFIHGWPYYEGGVDVPEGYSGGCIRMATEDMEKIYEFGSVGTPVIVLGGDADAAHGFLAAAGESLPEAGDYVLSEDAPTFPKLRAKSFVVGDLETGEVFARRDEEAIRPTASVAKLMTALVSLDILNQYQDIAISEEAVATEEGYGRLVAGEILSVGDLMYPLLLESSNDAAEALAETAGRGYFLRSMDEKAKSIGLTSTSYDDPAGLSADTVSTAADLFKLAQYLHKYKGFILKTSLVKEYALGRHRWVNSSKLLGEGTYAGGKHGYTPEAGKTLVATFTLKLSEFEKRPVAVVILDSSDPRQDALDAKRYLERWVVWNPPTGAAEEQTAAAL